MATTLSKKQARLLTLQSQGLLSSFAKREKGSQQAIEQISYIQIDTISVAARAHHHIFWSRVPDYQPEILDHLLSEKKTIFEYWSHAAAYLPMKDYRFSLPRKYALASGEKHWFDRDHQLMNLVVERIREEGPLQSKDFGSDEKRSEWWGWKPTKIALEHLFLEGTLMVAERKGFQKVYDLTERVLPPDTNTSMPSPHEMARHLIERAVHAHGFKTETEITYLRKGMKDSVKTALREMEEEGSLIPISVEGINQNYYTFPFLLNDIPQVIHKKQIHILSPFDNLVIQRKRLSDLFGFDYQIECYVPQPKRKYGYYCLPVLWGDTFIGRMDPKADRKTKTFYILNFWMETEIKDADELLPSLTQKIQDFAKFCGCERVVLENCTDRDFGDKLKTFFS
ncbi:MAG: crosslink repair DNA glycosylase YcaQ family protein [Bacteroidia bacterium]|nr:crosslink repair DNA glycosylase YcaQ family protein [Bacteroidia bacterium]